MKYIISILIGFIVIFYLEFFSYKSNKNTDYEFDFSIPKLTILENWNKNIHLYHVFDVKEKNININDKEKNSTIEAQITIKNRNFCIDKDCYNILSIINLNGTSYINLFSLSTKENIYLNTKSDLIKNLKFKVDNDIITLIDKNSSKKFTIDYFDINLSKYKPKENKTND